MKKRLPVSFLICPLGRALRGPTKSGHPARNSTTPPTVASIGMRDRKDNHGARMGVSGSRPRHVASAGPRTPPGAAQCRRLGQTALLATVCALAAAWALASGFRPGRAHFAPHGAHSCLEGVSGRGRAPSEHTRPHTCRGERDLSRKPVTAEVARRCAGVPRLSGGDKRVATWCAPWRSAPVTGRRP